MHPLHTTDALILSSSPQGESNRVYRLLTASHGMLYAHAQSVRMLRNRNRYALRTATRTNVTLVRGREVWRLVSARAIDDQIPLDSVAYRKFLDVATKLVPLEEPASKTYAIVSAAADALHVHTERSESIELIGMVRLLADLGYVQTGGGQHTLALLCADVGDYSDTVLQHALDERDALVEIVNTALRRAYE